LTWIWGLAILPGVVIRSPAFDPPEYVSWKPSEALLQEYEGTLRASRARLRLVEQLTPRQHLDLYAGLVRTRLLDTSLKRWVKQGVISKAWLGTGEEAVTVGNVHALRRGAAGDVVGPMIRNAGAYGEMGMPLAEVFKSYLGTEDQRGRGRDLHIGDLQYGIVPPISMVAALVPVCAGIALSFKQRREDRVALTWVGDGSTRTGDFHEGMSFAAALGVPLVVVVQNNQIALGTRVEVHTRAALEQLHVAYGIKGYRCNGNHVLDVLAATQQAVSDCRKGRGPVLLLAETFRMGGHATHDEAEARKLVPTALFRHWGERDPLGLYEAWLERSALALEEGLPEGLEVTDLPDARRSRNHEVLERVAKQVSEAVEAAAASALESRAQHMPDGSNVTEGLYARPLPEGT
jgi:TPP-dependent pyruvate/acetoin dehydrogenase alpha subunit